MTDLDLDKIEALARAATRGAIHIIDGGARGADALARLYRRVRLASGRTVRADWKTHGRGAGPIRNQAMIDIADGLVVVRYPDSRGSADVLSRAKAKRIPIVDVVLKRRRDG